MAGIRMVEIACPRCGSVEANQVTEAGAPLYVCHHCGTRYLVDHGRAHLPERPQPAVTPPTPRQTRSGTIVLTLLGGLALLVGGVIAAVNADEQKPRPPPKSSPPRSVTPELPPAKATLEGVLHGKNRIGSDFWLGTYRNLGEVTIRKPSLTVSLFDGDDRRIDELRGYAKRDALPPGQAATILVLATKAPAFARAEVTIGEPQAVAESKEVALSIEDPVSRAGAYSGTDIVGTLINTSDRPIDFAQVIAVGRNDAGDPVAFGSAYATQKALGPGERSGFKVSLSTWEIEPPKTFEAEAFGRLR